MLEVVVAVVVCVTTLPIDVRVKCMNKIPFGLPLGFGSVGHCLAEYSSPCLMVSLGVVLFCDLEVLGDVVAVVV